MSYINHAVSLLIQQIHVASPEAYRCTQSLIIPKNFDVIDWFDAQPVFPKFCWQSRDGQEEVIALGQLQVFTQLDLAYQVIQGEQRIWGGRSFDGGSAKNADDFPMFFFLPQVELIRHGTEWQLAVNLGHEPQTVIEQLNRLTEEVSALPPIQVHIRQQCHCPDESQWAEMIANVLDGVARQAFKKVVLARETILQLDGQIKPAQLLKASRQHNKDSFHYLLSFDEQHSIVGSPPERLYHRSGRTLYTEALAGTVGRGKTPDEDQQLADWLRHDPKNINENQYVVDDIVSHLTEYTDTMTVASSAEVVTLRKVHHLKRAIASQLKVGVTGQHLLDALQPTAAVAGLPREPAMAFIEREEPFVRGWYAGTVGYISQDEAEFCVAIRSARIQHGQVTLHAGAGIVPGSQPNEEWQELNRKVATLLSLLTDQQSEAGDSA